MSNLTLKLNDAEDEQLVRLKIIVNEKTSAGCIKKLIEGYESLTLRMTRLEIELDRTKNDKEELINSSKEYFKSMHKLMKDCEYEQNL